MVYNNVMFGGPCTHFKASSTLFLKLPLLSNEGKVSWCEKGDTWLSQNNCTLEC